MAESLSDLPPDSLQQKPFEPENGAERSKEGSDPKGTELAAAATDDTPERATEEISSPLTDQQKKLLRAERFGTPIHLSEEEKRSSRSERFGTASPVSGEKVVGEVEEQKRKARAERFGIAGNDTTAEEEAKKKARLERFSQNSKPDSVEEEKRKARAMRFAPPPKASSEPNNKPDSEQNAAVAET